MNLSRKDIGDLVVGVSLVVTGICLNLFGYGLTLVAGTTDIAAGVYIITSVWDGKDED